MDSEIKDVTIRFRATMRVAEKLQKKADEQGMKVSGLLRNMVAYLADEPRDELKEMYLQHTSLCERAVIMHEAILSTKADIELQEKTHYRLSENVARIKKAIEDKRLEEAKLMNELENAKA